MLASTLLRIPAARRALGDVVTSIRMTKRHTSAIVASMRVSAVSSTGEESINDLIESFGRLIVEEGLYFFFCWW